MSMICFSRREQIAVYHAFPEVICIDSTYQTNKVGFPLFQLVVTDSLGQGHTVMYALCSQERREDIEKLLECFKEIMCGTYATRTFIMDSAATEISAVQSTHSHSNIILCSFHVLRAFFRKFRNPDVRKCLEQLVKTRRSDIFTRKYEHLRTHFPRAYDYIKDYWIARKSMWARCYRRHVLSLGNHTNNRVESAHKHLKECLRRGDSLLLTFWKIWSKTDIDLRLRPYDAVKDLQRFPILPVSMSFRTLLNEFTSFAAKIVSVNYKRGHILYAHSKDLIRGDLFRHSNRWTRKYIMDLVLRALDNISISTGSDDLLEKFTSNYHSIHALSEPMASKLIRSCLEASEDICAQLMSSVGANDEATTSESIVNADHSYASC
ncbi:unnamed protein product [Schistosoma guineensis]|nr:unnamed protein product [Schistosoma guineensis]